VPAQIFRIAFLTRFDEWRSQALAGGTAQAAVFAGHAHGSAAGRNQRLVWRRFSFGCANPYWKLPAAFVKNRKEQPRPWHPERVAELQTLKAAGKLKPEDSVFPERGPPTKVIRADFKTAGIPLKDERGHVVGFPALRTTNVTRLQRAGVSPREALALARLAKG
jgi:hypothetical protein